MQARFGEDVTTGLSVALIYFEAHEDFEREYAMQNQLADYPPPTPASGMCGMVSAGRVIDSFEDPTRRYPYCCVVDGWQE
eukprot:SAG31_NODE_32168_length_359_cov_0.780769_1_plen_79_part_10